MLRLGLVNLRAHPQCRLEQWGHMCMWGMNEMYFYNMETGKNEALGEDAQWKYDSIMVFEGDFTVASDCERICDTVLGLWAKAIIEKRREGGDPFLYDIVNSHRERVFPRAMFPRAQQDLFEKHVAQQVRLLPLLRAADLHAQMLVL